MGDGGRVLPEPRQSERPMERVGKAQLEGTGWAEGSGWYPHSEMRAEGESLLPRQVHLHTKGGTCRGVEAEPGRKAGGVG